MFSQETFEEQNYSSHFSFSTSCLNIQMGKFPVHLTNIVSCVSNKIGWRNYWRKGRDSISILIWSESRKCICDLAWGMNFFLWSKFKGKLICGLLILERPMTIFFQCNAHAMSLSNRQESREVLILPVVRPGVREGGMLRHSRCPPQFWTPSFQSHVPHPAEGSQ